jgi:perosamine synthetase
VRNTRAILSRRLNPFWRQLPVYSPVTLGSVFAGLAAALGRGEPLDRLVELLRSEYRSMELLLFDSGTSALRLAIEAGMAETGSDIVALPAYCCFDVATAAVGADAQIALYDVLPETLGPDFNSLRRALETGARTLIVAHLYGIPVDLDRSRRLAEEYDAVLVEDAAQGAGGAWRGRPLGEWGDLGILSFGRGKGRTGGSGGALLANTERGVTMLDSLPSPRPARAGRFGSIAKLAVQWAFGRPQLYGIPASLPFLRLGETTYKEPWSPFSMRRSSAASLMANWEKAKEEELSRNLLTDQCALSLRYHDVGRAGGRESKAGLLRIPLLLESRPEAGTLSRLKKSGIVAGYPKPLCELSALHPRMIRTGPLLGARVLCDRLFTLPSHACLDVSNLPNHSMALKAMGFSEERADLVDP